MKKKIIFLLILISSITLASCKKEYVDSNDFSDIPSNNFSNVEEQKPYKARIDEYLLNTNIYMNTIYSDHSKTLLSLNTVVLNYITKNNTSDFSKLVVIIEREELLYKELLIQPTYQDEKINRIGQGIRDIHQKFCLLCYFIMTYDLDDNSSLIEYVELVKEKDSEYVLAFNSLKTFLNDN